MGGGSQASGPLQVFELQFCCFFFLKRKNKETVVNHPLVTFNCLESGCLSGHGVRGSKVCLFLLLWKNHLSLELTVMSLRAILVQKTVFSAAAVSVIGLWLIRVHLAQD